MVVVVTTAAIAVAVSLSAPDDVRVPVALLLTMAIYLGGGGMVYRHRPHPLTPPQPGPTAGSTPLDALDQDLALTPTRRGELVDLARRNVWTLLMNVLICSGVVGLWSGLQLSPIWVRALCPLAVLGAAYVLHRAHRDLARIDHHAEHVS